MDSATEIAEGMEGRITKQLDEELAEGLASF